VKKGLTARGGSLTAQSIQARASATSSAELSQRSSRPLKRSPSFGRAQVRASTQPFQKENLGFPERRQRRFRQMPRHRSRPVQFLRPQRFQARPFRLQLSQQRGVPQDLPAMCHQGLEQAQRAERGMGLVRGVRPRATPRDAAREGAKGINPMAVNPATRALSLDHMLATSTAPWGRRASTFSNRRWR
jgi:hypothetical protein